MSLYSYCFVKAPYPWLNYKKKIVQSKMYLWDKGSAYIASHATSLGCYPSRVVSLQYFITKISPQAVPIRRQIANRKSRKLQNNLNRNLRIRDFPQIWGSKFAICVRICEFANFDKESSLTIFVFLTGYFEICDLRFATYWNGLSRFFCSIPLFYTLNNA